MDDDDEDEIMLSATHQSQFTQSLMLFVRLTCSFKPFYFHFYFFSLLLDQVSWRNAVH